MRVEADMTTDDVKYESKTVQAVRGLEARTVAKWEEQGWEVVSQSRGRLRTDIVLRRPKKKLPVGIIAAAGGVALLLVAGIGFGTLMEDRDTDQSPRSASTASEGVSGSNSDADSSPSRQEAQKSEPPVLTSKNSAELASILKLGDYCDPAIERFAKKHQGQVIGISASIDAMNNHGNRKTRYDILLSAGAYSKTTSRGPAFQFRDENTTSDLNYRGEVPDSIGVGTNLFIEAEVAAYEPQSCHFLLEPVETAVR